MDDEAGTAWPPLYHYTSTGHSSSQGAVKSADVPDFDDNQMIYCDANSRTVGDNGEKTKSSLSVCCIVGK